MASDKSFGATPQLMRHRQAPVGRSLREHEHDLASWILQVAWVVSWLSDEVDANFDMSCRRRIEAVEKVSRNRNTSAGTAGYHHATFASSQ